jgi:hypothetical protein
MARSLKRFSFDPSEDFSGMLLGDSINRKASSTVSTFGRSFSTFGVETIFAWFVGTICSLTRYMKNARRLESFRAIELLLFFR